MSVALGPVIQNNADIWAASRPGVWWASYLCLLGVLGFDRGGEEAGRGWRVGLVEPLFSAAVWTFAAFNLTLDIVRQTNRLDSGGKGL